MPEYASLDPWGSPVYSNSQGPYGPAQLTEVAALAMARGVRHFATRAALLAATGHAAGYLAAVDTVPGALWVATSSSAGAWSMSGEPSFADSAARAAAITTPAAGMVTRLADGGRWRYSGSAWVSLQARHTEYTATSASVASTSASSIGTPVIEASPPSNDTALATISTNTLTILEAGIYALDVSATIMNGGSPTTPTGTSYVTAAGTVQSIFDVRAIGTSVSPIIGGGLLSARYLIAGTVITFTFFHTSSGNRSLVSRIALTKLA